MKQYSELAAMLFNIKKQTLPTLLNSTAINGQMLANDLGRQLRKDLDTLKKEVFADRELSIADMKELRKINEKLMVKFSVLMRRFEKDKLITIAL
jgi:hypothetical protein